MTRVFHQAHPCAPLARTAVLSKLRFWLAFREACTLHGKRARTITREQSQAVTSVPTAGGVVAEPVRVRRLTDQEGQKLQQIVRRGSTSSVRYRRAMMLLASAGGNRVPVIAQLVQADEDTVRDVIHRFNEMGLACLDPRWAGGRPRLLSPDDEDFVVPTATTRPTKLGQPFTRWSHPQTRRLPAQRPRPRHPYRPGGFTVPAPPPRHHLPAHQDVEGVHRPRARRQARPHRARPGALPGPGLRLRRVRAAGDPPHRRLLLGERRASPTGCRRPTTAPTASPTSTAATPSATTACGASTAAAKAPPTRWPR